MDRVLALTGVHNFRDYGGYAVPGGGRLKHSVLWRSGQHHGATHEDLDRIAALSLVSVFDLRSSRERTDRPCRRPAMFAAQIHCSDDPGQHSAPHIATARVKGPRTPQSTHEQMIRTYAKIAFRPELQAMTARLIRAASAGPSLVNCMAGKDRTGIAVAMVLLAAGVHRDDVMEDYLLTNTAGDVEARIAAGAESIRAATGTIDDASLRVLMSVEPIYLQTALTAIEAEHGSVEHYLEHALGADRAACEQMRARLME